MTSNNKDKGKVRWVGLDEFRWDEFGWDGYLYQKDENYGNRRVRWTISTDYYLAHEYIDKMGISRFIGIKLIKIFLEFIKYIFRFQTYPEYGFSKHFNTNL